MALARAGARPTRAPGAPDPAAWLREHGFNPKGDLCKLTNSKSYRGSKTTAMYEAAFAGELNVCKYLWDHGAAGTIRTKSEGGSCGTPMSGACFKGHLDVAQWLFEMGAAVDIRTPNNYGWTPMLATCANDEIGTAKWLFKMGAAEDIFTKDNHGYSPMVTAILFGSFDMVEWLCQVGAAEDIVFHHDEHMSAFEAAERTGNFDMVALVMLEGGSPPDLIIQVPARDLPGAQAHFQLLLAEHATFTSVVLPAVRFGAPRDATTPPPQLGRGAVTTRAKRRRAAGCPLALLRGLEQALLPLVADFAAVLRGARLKNARDALKSFEAC